MKKCVVVGGGVIGLCSAYYLAKSGHKVLVLDKARKHDGCSYGNAGMIVPSHAIPLAQPGMIQQGFRWMLNSQSPFYVRPRLDIALLKWGYQFYKHANQEHVQKAMPALKELSLLSKSLFQEFAELDSCFSYQEKGLLMLYKTAKMEDELHHEAEAIQALGLPVEFLDASGVAHLETNVKAAVLGGVHYTSDAHLHPERFIQFLKKQLTQLGVEIHYHTRVTDFETNAKKITGVLTKQKRYCADEVVLACGAWSPEIAKKLGNDIKVLPGKGYSFTLNSVNNLPSIPSILCEGKVAVTPWEDAVRFSGTLEITHVKDTKIRNNRVQGIKNTLTEFYPELNHELLASKEIWYGFRPCTPSGLPIIRKGVSYSNVTVATGHAMMGLSLAPATGWLVMQLINELPTTLDLSLYR